VLLQASILLLKLFFADNYTRLLSKNFGISSEESRHKSRWIGSPIQYTCSRASWIPKKKIFRRYDNTQRPWQDISRIMGLTVFKAPFFPEMCYSLYGLFERKLKAVPGCEVYLVLITSNIL